MNEQKKLAQRLDRARRELDECAETLARIARDVETIDRTKPDLVGQKEIAAMAKMNPSTLGVYISRGKLPEPVAVLACGRIWNRADIASWIKARGR